jgi:hypothetical protein
VFNITSGDCSFAHATAKHRDDFMLENSDYVKGTMVYMRTSDKSKRTMEEVTEAFSSPDCLTHSKTIVPLSLAKLGKESLVSRSQAKLVLVGLDKFNTVILDFEGVERIGQGFADEIFRVFANKNPDVSLVPINANTETAVIIEAARQGWKQINPN